MKVDTEMKRGATLLCKLEGCMGNPKDLVQAENFVGSICRVCFAVHEYIPDSLNPKKLELVKKELTEKEQARLKAQEEKERLEKGLETESEIEQGRQYKSTGKGSKKFVKKPKKHAQANLFEELPDIVSLPKKVEEKVLRLGIEKEKKEAKNKAKKK